MLSLKRDGVLLMLGGLSETDLGNRGDCFNVVDLDYRDKWSLSGRCRVFPSMNIRNEAIKALASTLSSVRNGNIAIIQAVAHLHRTKVTNGEK